MAYWSAENATKAYLNTLKMDQKAKEPAVAEFISALAAGNNAQEILVACAGEADSTTLLALIAAANQTGGNVICMVPTQKDLISSKNSLGIIASSSNNNNNNKVKFMVGEAQESIMVSKNQIDFVLIDCNLVNHEKILQAIQFGGVKEKGIVVVGYNAFGCRGSWWSCASKTQLLPIGKGLLVAKFGGIATNSPKFSGMSKIINRRSRWIVKVDKCTGEEHVYRIPHGKVIQA